MNNNAFPLIGALLLVVSAQTTLLAGTPRQLTREQLLDKIRGAWAGQMIGVSYGAATEFRSHGEIFGGEIKPEPLANAIDQDDLYVEMTFAEVLDRKGLEATTEDFGEAFRTSKYSLWHANASARKNLSRGLKPPLSGDPRYNLHADDIDFQIEADFIGIMCPGLPRAANDFCQRVGHVMNYGDGVYGGMFVAGMYSAAYFESDPRRVVEAGLACIPRRSGYAAVLRDVLAFAKAHPDDWRAVWRLIEDKWNRNDPCPDGVLNTFNIDARLNGAYIAIGLLYGGGDFDRTMEIATRCGQDSDCNPSSAAGVMGAILGYSRIPAKYQADLAALAGTKFSFTQYSFTDIVKSTEKRALLVVERAGGKVTDSEVVIPRQSPRAPRLEQSRFGVPDKIVGLDDPAWRWSGSWTREKDVQVATGAGSELVLTFKGAGIALAGQLRQNGGRADVFIDGVKQDHPADAWIPEHTSDNDLWHRTGLKPGEHTLRLVTTDDADPQSKGRRLGIVRAIVYRAN